MKHNLIRLFSLRRFITRIYYRSLAQRLLFLELSRRGARLEVVRIGSSYGSWSLPRDFKYANNQALLAGAGEDLTLDKYMADNSWDVLVLDPTPRAILAFKRELSEYPNVTLIEAGIWNENSEVKFYLPKNASHVSLSATNMQNSTEFLVLPVVKFSTICLEHNFVPSLVKLDIEGAAPKVIQEMLASKYNPQVLLVDFELGTRFFEMIKSVHSLLKAGYFLNHFDGQDCQFIKN